MTTLINRGMWLYDSGHGDVRHATFITGGHLSRIPTIWQNIRTKFEGLIKNVFNLYKMKSSKMALKTL
jgi:hypothetical protein